MMVGTLGIVLAYSLAAPIGGDSASTRAQGPSLSGLPHSVLSSLHADVGAAQEPVPQEPKPIPEEDKKPQPADATVEGHVRLRDGRPAAGARVVAKGPEGTIANATADGAGRFRFTGPAGTYSLEIHAGDRRGTFKANIAAGRLTPAEFTVE